MGKKIWYDSFQEYLIVTCHNVFFYSFLFLFSSHVRAESGFWDPGNFCWCNPEARNYLLAQSGSQLISAVKSGILGFGNRNIAQRIRSPTNDWNPESNFRRQRIRKQGKFCWWNPESSKFLLSKPESWALELKESGISLTIGIQNSSSTNREWNPVPEIRNPRRGTKTPRLFWLPLHWTKDYIANKCIFYPFLFLVL